jgi:hypothetical protein
MKQHFKWVVLCLIASAYILFAKVIVDYNHSADFSKYHTYSWLQVKAGDPLWPDRIKAAVDRQLATKGWTPVPSGGDAAVAALGVTKEQQTLQTFYDSFGGGWYWQGFSDGVATTTVSTTPVGTLVVDIFDGPTKKLIWRGQATETLSDKPDKNEKKLEKAVEEMFKKFPPKETPKEKS